MVGGRGFLAVSLGRESGRKPAPDCLPVVKHLTFSDGALLSENDPWLAEQAYQSIHWNNPGKGEPALESRQLLEKVWGRRCRRGECAAPGCTGPGGITVLFPLPS